MTDPGSARRGATETERWKFASRIAPVGDAPATAYMTSMAACPINFDSGDVMDGEDGHQGLFDQVLGQERQAHLMRQHGGKRRLAATRRPGNDHVRLRGGCHRGNDVLIVRESRESSFVKPSFSTGTNWVMSPV